TSHRWHYCGYSYLGALVLILLMNGCFLARNNSSPTAWIRVNQLGYTPEGVKVAVWGTKEEKSINHFTLTDAATGRTVYEGEAGNEFGSYGPFKQTYRLDFSSFSKPGRYYLQAGNARSPEFAISPDVYNGTAD